VKRREFIGLIGGVATWPLVGRAQQSERMRRIGVLISQAADDSEMEASLAGFRQGLERLGWSEGSNVRIDTRFAHGNLDQTQVHAKELIALQPDVILAHSTPVAATLQRESRAILARPDGNLTGLLMYEASIVGKWLAMLKEIAPRMARVAFVANPKISTYEYYLRTAKAIAPSLAIELVPSPIETAADIERAIELFAREPNGGLFLPPNTTNNVHRALIIALAARHRLPAVYAFRFFVADGGLMSYAIDQVDMFRQTASYVDRILRGAKPVDIPVQAPTKFKTTLNLKTAKALGLTVPPGMLVAADEVIE
jgi:putative ABC transport system substrate-binding protein